MWVINPAVGCHYLPPGPQLPSQSLTGLLQFCYLVNRGTMGVNSCLRLLPDSITATIRTQALLHQDANHSANNPPEVTHTHLMSHCPRLPVWAGTRKIKPMWILLKKETVSGSGIRWAICKSAPRSRQTTTPAPHSSVFYRPDALPAAQPTASKHWRQIP